MKNILITIAVLAVLVVAGFYALNSYIYHEKQADTEYDFPDDTTVGIEDLIRVESPVPGTMVGDPLIVEGEARGYWFFEATAPVVVTNWDGLIIGEGYISAVDEWMTEEFVPFTGEIDYDLPADTYSATGTIIFHKANASGLPEHDQAFEYQVILSQ